MLLHDLTNPPELSHTDRTEQISGLRTRSLCGFFMPAIWHSYIRTKVGWRGVIQHPQGEYAQSFLFGSVDTRPPATNWRL